MRTFRLVSLFLILSFLLIACGAKPSEVPADNITIRVPFTIWPGNYPMAIAQQQGFFARHGVSVEIIYYESYPQSYQDYVTGNLDGLSVSIGDILPNLSKRASRIVMTTDSSEGADQLLVADNIQSVADLKGKRIGVNFNTYGDYWVRQLLKANGMQVSDVQMVNLSVENMPPAFLKSVDASHSYEPYTTEALKNGGHVLLTSADTSRWQIPSTFVFSEDMVKNHPQAVRGFVAAFFEGVDWLYAHNEQEVLTLVSQQLDLPLEYFWLGGDYVMTLADNKKLLHTGDDFSSIYYTSEIYIDFLAETGNLNSAPDMSKLVDASFLP